MHTWFEIVLPDPTENRLAAAEAALDEIERVEGVLSRFDPASETWRVNRQAAQAPVRLSVELAAFLQRCRDFCAETEGYFDVTAGSVPAGTAPEEVMQLDEVQRTLFFLHPEVRLDFGAVGKGYALDRAALVLQEMGVTDALLHGGTSSVRALGTNGGHPWRVGLRALTAGAGESGDLFLQDASLSVSGSVHPGQKISDVINPHTGQRLEHAAFCAVQAADGVAAEVYATAFLCLGREKAELFCHAHPDPCRTVIFSEAGGTD